MTPSAYGHSADVPPVYGRQRPAIEYLLGVARQRGIRVVLAPGSTLKVPPAPASRDPRSVRIRLAVPWGMVAPKSPLTAA